MSIVSSINAIPPAFVMLSVALAIMFGITTFYLIDKQVKINKYAYLVTMMAKADNKGGLPKPLGIIVDRSGKMIPFVSEPDTRNKGLLANDNYTLINPDLVKPSARLHFHRGPDALFYPLPGYFPLNIHSSAALVQLAQDFRENKYFNWIPNEIDVLSLLFNGTNTLYEDCLTVINDAAKFGNEVPVFLLNDEEEYEEVEEEIEEMDEFVEGDYEEIDEEDAEEEVEDEGTEEEEEEEYQLIKLAEDDEVKPDE